jgi:hypothetical protein
MKKLFAALEGVGVTFDDLPEPISADLRSSWRIASLLLILHLACRQNKASILKVSLLNWTLRHRAIWQFVHQQFSSPDPLPIEVRYDPSLTRAIDYAAAEGLIAIDKGKLQLQKAGALFAENIVNSDTLSLEREYLRAIRPYATEKRVKEILGVSAS